MSLLNGDNFIRSNTGGNVAIANAAGWNTASNGAWTQAGTGTPTWSIQGNQGEATNANANTFAFISASSFTDTNQIVRVKTSSVAASNFQGLVLRYTSGANCYRCYLSLGTTLTVARGATSIATFSFSYSANSENYIRFQIIGTTLTARVWAAGNAEPTVWQITQTDANFASGQSGLFISPDAVGTTAFYDSYQLNSGAFTSGDPITRMRKAWTGRTH